jgi:predicted AAA+ superfamily ATPase
MKKPARKRSKRSAPKEITLSPTQASAFDSLSAALDFGRFLVVWGAPGLGKSTILRQLHAARFPSAPLISTKDLLAEMADRHPLALEEAYADILRRAFRKSNVVLADDLHLLDAVVCCHYYYPRKSYFTSALTAVVNEAVEADHTLIVGCTGAAPAPIHQRAYYHGVKRFKAADYRHLSEAYLPGDIAARLDYEKIHRFAPQLNGHQLRGAAEELAKEPSLDTQRFIDYVRLRRMASNVDVGEVQAVDLRSLKGLDDVIESLEANIVLPFENDRIATELGVKPKRGVLLIGPPGTGKTTVGRALAHRLRSKFFLIDGTIISGTREFYEQIQKVAEAAKRNAPSIIFIDDSDVIFEQGREQGLYRYLLTMLDGIESETAGRVSVIMTAMDVGALPPALIRSGRIELWLETRLPDDAARAEILRELFAKLPEAMPAPDLDPIVKESAGLTGADLKRIVEDAKLLFAFDRAKDRPTTRTNDYLVKAIAAVRANKERYAEAEARVRAAQAARPRLDLDYGYTPSNGADADPA